MKLGYPLLLPFAFVGIGAHAADARIAAKAAVCVACHSPNGPMRPSGIANLIVCPAHPVGVTCRAVDEGDARFGRDSLEDQT